MRKAKILACGSSLPARAVTNDHLSATLDTSDEWILTRTGIKQRYIAEPSETTAALATQALARALDRAAIDPNSLDAIILATVTPDQVFPATAVQVQGNLGITRGFAFDLQAACSGFLYALSMAK